jgi:hypothetical protein
MKPRDAEKLLIGKTIKTINHHKYMIWDMCIDEIVFTDGTVAEFGGNADEAYIHAVTLPNGERHSVAEDD